MLCLQVFWACGHRGEDGHETAEAAAQRVLHECWQVRSEGWKQILHCLRRLFLSQSSFKLLDFFFFQVICKSKKEGKHKVSQQILQVRAMFAFIFVCFDDVIIHLRVLTK